VAVGFAYVLIRTFSIRIASAPLRDASLSRPERKQDPSSVLARRRGTYFLILHPFNHAYMVLSTTGRVSRVGILQQRLAANPAVQEGFEESLEDTHHYKILVQATVRAHNRMRNLWKEFAESHDATLSAEITVGSVLPTLGA
jgi:hypothetical protein